jgi:membrane associated rhomboid family serine protease
MHQASVGFHCPDCLSDGKQKVYTARTVSTSPVATQILIGLNVAVFIAQVLTAKEADGVSATSISVDLDMRALNVGFLDEYYRLFTAGFLHFGLFHIALNMYALWILGGLLERSFGWMRMVPVYMASILGGSVGVAIIDPNSASLGASGGVFGLMGMLLVAEWSMGRNPFQSRIGGLLLINLVITFGVPGISIGGHLGGLVAGAASGYVMLELKNRRVSERLSAAVGVGLVLAFFALGILLSEQHVAGLL